MNIDLLSKEEIESFLTTVKASERIILCCHRSPDGDALGAMLGLSEYLKTLGKLPVGIIPDAYPDFLQWLPGSERIIRYDKNIKLSKELILSSDLIFCLDFNTLSRTADMQEVLESSKAKKILIDHHPSPDIATILSVSLPEASSTSELVFRLIWQLGGFEEMTKKCATSLYCGMMTDTGGFTYNSSSAELYFIISQLILKQINKDKIYRNVYSNYRECRLRLVGYVLYSKLQVISSKKASYFTLSREDLKRFNYIKGDAEGLVNMPLQIKGLRLSISLREDTEKDNLIWVSLRSIDDFPCNKMAEIYFNGGGHLNASGGRLECSMEEAIKITQKAIEEFE